MPDRQIYSRARSSSVQLVELLGSLFAIELMAPSQALYLTSPWISDMPVLNNRYGQLRAVMPELSKDWLGLAAVLAELAERGAQVRIACREDQPETRRFLDRLPPAVAWRHSPALHVKGLITDHFYLRGSMNFTYSGVYINDEQVELTTRPELVASALLDAQMRWEAPN